MRGDFWANRDFFPGAMSKSAGGVRPWVTTQFIKEPDDAPVRLRHHHTGTPVPVQAGPHLHRLGGACLIRCDTGQDQSNSSMKTENDHAIHAFDLWRSRC